MPPVRQTPTSASALVPGLSEALRENYERVPVGHILLGADRRIIAVNEALSRLAGISASRAPS